MHGAQAVTDFGSNLPTSSASRPRATKHTYCENDHFHEPTGTWYAHQIISLISLSWYLTSYNLKRCFPYLQGIYPTGQQQQQINAKYFITCVPIFQLVLDKYLFTSFMLDFRFVSKWSPGYPKHLLTYLKYISKRK